MGVSLKNNINKTIKMLSLLFILFLAIGLASASDIGSINGDNGNLQLSNDDLVYVDSDGVSANSDFADLDYVDCGGVSCNSDLTVSEDDLADLDDDLSSSANSLSDNNIHKSAETVLKSNYLSESNNITVNHTGNDLSDIQNAIDLAKLGDTVLLGDYQYNIGSGQIELNKAITLLGTGSTLINGTGGVKVGCVIEVNRVSGARIQGIVFNNYEADLSYTDYDTLYGWAIRLDSASNILIDNCSFINYNREVNIDGSNYVTVSNSYFTGTSTRITNGNGKERGTRAISFSSDSKYNRIINNTFEGSVLDGINVDAASSNEFIGNTFINNSYAIFLDHSASENLTIANNTFIHCGHFEALYQGQPVNYQNLPIIDAAASFSDFKIENNTFYVTDSNVLIKTSVTSEIGNVSINGNNVILLDNSSDINASTITFFSCPVKESLLYLIGNIVIANNSMDEDMVYTDFGSDTTTVKDGDLIIYGPRDETELKINTDSHLYANLVKIGFVLNGINSKSVPYPLSGDISVDIFNEDLSLFNSYNISIIDGNGELNITDFEIAKYTVFAKFLGDDSNEPVNASSEIEILDYSNTVLVNHTGNGTKDIIDAIESAVAGDIIDLGDYSYKDIETITIDKNLKFIGAETNISIAKDSDSVFLVQDQTDLSISNIGLNFSSDNQSLVNVKTSGNLGQMELTNISVTSDNGLDNSSLNLLKVESDDQLAFDNIYVKDNKLLNGMKAVNLIAPSRKESTQFVFNNLTATAVVASEGKVGDYFTFTFKDGNGKVLVGKNISVGFNGHIYTYITDSKGQARVQINLNTPGGYTFALCFLGDEDYNASFAVAKITVIQKKMSLTVPAKTYKASAKTKTLTATLKDNKGKTVKGKKISFTVNGKTYTATTNAKGIATVKVSLSTKKTYSFTVKFAGDRSYGAVTKKGKVVIK